MMLSDEMLAIISILSALIFLFGAWMVWIWLCLAAGVVLCGAVSVAMYRALHDWPGPGAGGAV